MNEVKAKEALALLGEAQRASDQPLFGAHYCPRCGENRMRENLYHNASSRHADCYICPECGTEEAIEDMVGKQKPLAQWNIIVNVLDVLNGEEAAK